MRQTRRNTKRLAALIAAPALAALALTACSSGTGSTVTTITFGIPTETGKQKPYTSIVADFEKANPDIKVNVLQTPNTDFGQVIKTQFQAGNAPDAVEGSPGTGDSNGLGSYMKAGYLLDLSDQDWAVKSVPASAKAEYYVGKKLEGLPLEVAPLGMNINQTAFDELGLKPATTYNGWLEQCSVARDKGKLSLISLSGSTPPNTGMMAMQLAAGTVYAKNPDWNAQRATGKVTFSNSPGWTEALKQIQQLNNAKCFEDGAAGGTFDTLFNDVSAGKSLGFFGPSGSVADLESLNPNSKFTVVAFPAKDAKDTLIYASPTYAIGVNAKTQHKDAVLKFVKYWSTPAVQDKRAKLSGNASLNSVLNGAKVDPKFSQIESYLTDPKKNIPFAPDSWPNGGVYNALGVGVQGLITGQATVSQVLKNMDDAWSQQ